VVLATLSKLKQVCNHPAQFLADNSPIPGRSGKLARLTEMMQEVMESGERALVFSQFAEMGAIVWAHLQSTFGREVLFLHGGVPRAARERMVERFQAAREGPLAFVLSLKAGGTGLNLTAANHVVLYDRWWNPAVEDQALTARSAPARRAAQVHKLICPGTLEEKIDAMTNEEGGGGEGGGQWEGWLTAPSTAELRCCPPCRRGGGGGSATSSSLTAPPSRPLDEGRDPGPPAPRRPQSWGPAVIAVLRVSSWAAGPLPRPGLRAARGRSCRSRSIWAGSKPSCRARARIRHAVTIDARRCPGGMAGGHAHAEARFAAKLLAGDVDAGRPLLAGLRCSRPRSRTCAPPAVSRLVAPASHRVRTTCSARS
jgi:hypothetical protein